MYACVISNAQIFSSLHVCVQHFSQFAEVIHGVRICKEKKIEQDFSPIAEPQGISRKTEVCITQYCSTVYIGIAMVFVFLPYSRKFQFLLSLSSMISNESVLQST